MIRLIVFLLISALKSTMAYSVYPDQGPGLGDFAQEFLQDIPRLQDTDNHAFAILMPMTAFFDQSASVYGAPPQSSYQEQHGQGSQSAYQEPPELGSHQPSGYDLGGSDEQIISNEGYSDFKSAEEKDYGTGLGVGGLDLGDAGPATHTYSSAGPAINSYGHSGSGSSDWVPIKNPHHYY